VCAVTETCRSTQEEGCDRVGDDGGCFVGVVGGTVAVEVRGW